MRVIFDFDGTLINSKKRHIVVLKDAIQKLYGKERNWDLADYMSCKRNGLSTRDFLQSHFSLAPKEISEIVSFWTNHIEDNEYLELDVLFSETVSILEWLHDHNICINLLTARKNKAGLMHQLIRCDIIDFFSSISIVDPFNAYQEKQELIEGMIMPEDIIVGDTEIEHRIATSLNARSIMLSRGFRSKEFWKTQGVDAKGAISNTIKKMILEGGKP